MSFNLCYFECNSDVDYANEEDWFKLGNVLWIKLFSSVNTTYLHKTSNDSIYDEDFVRK